MKEYIERGQEVIVLKILARSSLERYSGLVGRMQTKSWRPSMTTLVSDCWLCTSIECSWTGSEIQPTFTETQARTEEVSIKLLYRKREEIDRNRKWCIDIE